MLYLSFALWFAFVCCDDYLIAGFIFVGKSKTKTEKSHQRIPTDFFFMCFL